MKIHYKLILGVLMFFWSLPGQTYDIQFGTPFYFHDGVWEEMAQEAPELPIWLGVNWALMGENVRGSVQLATSLVPYLSRKGAYGDHLRGTAMLRGSFLGLSSSVGGGLDLVHYGNYTVFDDYYWLRIGPTVDVSLAIKDGPLTYGLILYYSQYVDMNTSQLVLFFEL